MTKVLSRIASLSILWMFAIACSGTYSILSPEPGSLHTEPPAEFKIGYNAKPESLPAVVLNGISIESLFTLGDTEAVVAGDDVAQYLKEGQNRFQVGPPLGPIVFFTYDTAGPDIIVHTADSEDPTTISGLAVDAMGVDYLVVNGIGTTPDSDGAFSSTVEAADIYTFEAADSLAHVSTTQYARFGLLYDPSLRVRANQSGIDFATGQMLNIINGLDINSLIVGTSLYDETWTGPLGETYGADGFLNGLTLSAESFDLQLGDAGASNFTGTINNIHIDLSLRLHNGFLPPTVLNIGATAGPVDIAGDLGLSAVDHQPVIDLTNFDLSISNVLLDPVPDIFQPLVSPIVTGILSLFDGLIAGAIENELAAQLPGVFSDLIQESYTMTLSERDMQMVLQLEEATTSSGSLLISLSGGVTPLTIDTGIPQPLGPRYTSDSLPEPEPAIGDFAVAVNTNVINQTLVAAYYVGLFHMNMINDVTHFGSVRDDGLGEDGDSRTLVEAESPPYISITEVDGAANTTFAIKGLKVQSEKKEGGVYNREFGVTLNAEAEISIAVNTDNTLSVTFVSTPVIDITKIELANGEELNSVLNEIIETFVVNQMQGVMLQLATPLTGIALPTFGCTAFTADTFSALGITNTHAGMAGTLTSISTDCDTPVTPPPAVAYGRGVGTPMICGVNEQYDAGLCYEYCNEGYSGVGPVCWKDNASYGRGVGTVANLTCAANEDLDGALCYPKCAEGYHGVGPVCWTDEELSYGRGAGVPLSSWCSGGKEEDAGLCYTPCSSGYNGVGPVCWSTQPLSYGRGVGTIPNWFSSNPCGSKQMDAGLCYPYCNSGYTGVGPVCWLDNASYGRGVGTPMTFGCTGGMEEDAGLCYNQCNSGYTGVGPVCWKDNASYGRTAGTVPALTCNAGEELDAGLCYEVCSEGFHGVGPVCWTNEAISYGRGVGVPIHTCSAGQDLDAGLCYDQCAAGYHGVGPVCWPN